MKILKVIDVSEWQKDIDWAKVKSQCDGAILRIGYGSDAASQDDKYWTINVAQCELHGIPWGAYLYSYAENVTMAESEIAHALRCLKGKKPQFPVYYDIETASSAYIADKIYPIWEQRIRQAGFIPGLYTYQYLFNAYHMEKINCTTLWCAAYGNNDPIPEDWEKPKIGKNYDSWQFTSTGSMDGIKGHVDISSFFKDLRKETDGKTKVILVKPIEEIENAVYRIFHPTSQSHLFTTSLNEVKVNVARGWKYEGSNFKCAELGRPSVPVYRLVSSLEHFYTTGRTERENLLKYAWKDEGIGWNAPTYGKPVFRSYSDRIGRHMFTADKHEHETLTANGWHDEGIAFYG